jgi:hypothetical protein
MRRNKPDAQGRHPWKAEATEGDPSVSAAVINSWYESVYAPLFAGEPPENGSIPDPDLGDGEE